MNAWQMPDHPRLRGVNLAPRSEGDITAWIIPAYAGLTFITICPFHFGSDHPRLRGGNTWRSLESQRCPTLPGGFCLHW